MTGLGKKKKEKISMAKESNMSDNEVKKEKKSAKIQKDLKKAEEKLQKLDEQVH